jgi:branched-chain amino acid aminotransferase
MSDSSFKESISINGQCMSIDTASIPVTDRGFLFGDSIYEVFRTYSGIPLYFESHWKRFLNSSSLIKLSVPFTQDRLISDLRDLCSYSDTNINKDYYIRIILTRGDGFDLHAQHASPPRLVLIIRELVKWNPAYYRLGISLWATSVLRNSKRALDPNIKGGNYLNNILGVIDANESDYDDAIFLNADGEITESSTANLFFVFRDRICTPYVKSGLLKGITRQALLGINKINNLPIIEERLTFEQINQADEAFITSSTRGVMPIKRVGSKNGIINFKINKTGVIQAIALKYRNIIAAHIEKNKHLSLYS